MYYCISDHLLTFIHIINIYIVLYLFLSYDAGYKYNQSCYLILRSWGELFYSFFIFIFYFYFLFLQF